jgi:hypothetical protein
MVAISNSRVDNYDFNGFFGGDEMPRPTRADAEQSENAFYEVLDFAQKQRKLTLQQIGNVLGGLDKSTVSKKIQSKGFSEDQRALVLHYLYVERQLLTDDWRKETASIPHVLHFALLQFFRINPTSHDNAASRIAGTFELWRPSVESLNEYVHGRLTFALDEKTDAILAQMIQRQKSEDGLHGGTEELNGCLFRVGDMYAMVLRDATTNDLRITIFPRYRTESIGQHIDKHSVFPENTKHIIQMDGFEMGKDGRDFVFTPVFVSLVDNKDQLDALNGKLDVVPEGKVPPRVVRRLNKYPLIIK